MSWTPKFLRGKRGGDSPAADPRATDRPAEVARPDPAPAAPEPTLSVAEAEARLTEGAQAAETGNADRARALFGEVEQSGRLGEWAAFRTGLLEREAGDEAAAEAAFGRAIGRAPDLFWAHYERLRLPTVRADRGRRDRYVEALLEIEWEPIERAHVAELDAVALAVWSDGKRDLAGRLLAKLFPTNALGAEALDRIVETALDPALVEAAAARRDAVAGDDAERDRRAFDAAVADFEGGRLTNAAIVLESLSDTDAYRGWANFYLGRIYSGEADQGRALRAFDAAIAAEPTLFWAHFERAVLASTLAMPAARLAGYIDTMAALPWEPLKDGHVGELEQVAHALWEREDRLGGVRLLARLWPSNALSKHALVRIVEVSPDRELQRQAVERLHGLPDLDATALRVISIYHQRHGEGDREIALLERAFEANSDDFETWVGLVRSFAVNGERERAFAAIAGASGFSAQQRHYATLVAQVELGDVDDAFLGFRDACRLYGEVPKYAGIRIAYRLADQFDVARRDEVVGILAANYPGDRDIALVLINAAMRDQRWGDARAVWDAHFVDGPELAQDVRLARIDILAYGGELDEAARRLEAERVDGALPGPFLRSSIRILSELDRWDEVFAVGLAQLGDDTSYVQFLSVLIRAARKLGTAERLLDALLALPRPLAPEQVEAVHAVAEDLAELGHADVLARIEGVELPFERRQRIELKLRGQAPPPAATPDLCIYYCADRDYLTPALVSLTSLAVSNVSLARRAVFQLVVETDVVDVARDAATAIASRLGLTIEVIDASEIVPSTGGLRTSYGLFTGGQQLALAAYYRIFVARWLVDQRRFARALYVDADTIVRGGLDELFAVEHAAPMLARPDTDRPEVRHATALHGLRGAYFNSGVLQFDLAHPDLPALLDRALAAAVDPAVTLVFQDQCALNIAFDTRVGDLPDRFNYFNPPTVSGDGIPASEAVIVHFLDRPKPWDSLYRLRAREWFEWFDLVEMLRQGPPAAG